MKIGVARCGVVLGDVSAVFTLLQTVRTTASHIMTLICQGKHLISIYMLDIYWKIPRKITLLKKEK